MASNKKLSSEGSAEDQSISSRAVSGPSETMPKRNSSVEPTTQSNEAHYPNGEPIPRNAKRKNRGREIGRSEWSRNPGNKRERHERPPKRQRTDGEDEQLPIYATRFSNEEIAAQERQPKRKVAVMIGYSGSGYKGMQLNHHEKTIEGDLFAAFVAAGAISKVNADDPKKSSLVRCARTDKGVHAAGNLISLKLVIEDPDIVAKINQNLSPQIRVWGIERTNGGFSAYQMCDSRIYEYLIPSHCFLPPYSQSFLGRRLQEIAEEEGDEAGYLERLDDTAEFWTEVEDRAFKPIIDGLQPSIRERVLRTFHGEAPDPEAQSAEEVKTSEELGSSETTDSKLRDEDNFNHPPNNKEHGEKNTEPASTIPSSRRKNPVDTALRSLKDAQSTAKTAYRISPTRLARIQSVLSHFHGSHKFHNYTIDKSSRDASATRVIKSFTVDTTPIHMGGTEWLSLKVHGQSFMMHQIRKMVCAAAMVVRCGCHESRIHDTYTSNRLSIPKAPSLGLLLERPVFHAFNTKLTALGREKIDFAKHEERIREFKEREIYDRIFAEEERDAGFMTFFGGLDSTRSASLFWATSAGVDATRRPVASANAGDLKEVEGEDEVDG